MMTTIYKIESVTDREGNEKDNQYRLDRWKIYLMDIGRSAILIDLDNNMGRNLQTSKVEEIKIIDNSIIFTTRNSVYTLRPYAQGV